MIDLIAAGANRVPQSAGLRNGELLYSSQQFLLVWTTHGITETYDLGSQVTCVVGNGQLVLAGTQEGDLYLVEAEPKRLASLGTSVTCLAIDKTEIAVGTSDGYLRQYRLSAAEDRTLHEVAAFKINDRFYPLVLAISNSFLAIGGTAGSIYLRRGEVMVELQGHEGWIRGLDFRAAGQDLVLASGSQDKYVRLWRLVEGFDREDGSELGLSTKSHQIDGWHAKFEALLIGHDDWVVSLKWDPHSSKLLSASSDSSLIIWAEGDDSTHFSTEEGESLWMPQIRLGDVSIMGASTATGASGGFWTALWTDEHVATVSKTGSWRLWTRRDWRPVPGMTGHTKSVTDVAWFGNHLLSTSLDQTTRMWSQVTQPVAEAAAININPGGFYEVSRPQIHGYDMTCIAAIDGERFISAGDEKILRVFMEPKSVAELLAGITGDQPRSEEVSLPVAAAVPALGLSNKAQESEDETLLHFDRIPLEEQLHRLTLWPEIEKLYGHGYEISCVDVSPNREFVATCCRANSAKHAVVRVYTTDNWRQLEPLGGHTLTVTRARFSPDGQYLLTVSRDRGWILHSMESMTASLSKPKAHTRIIWDCSWLDVATFVTVSRDKSLSVWTIDGERLKSVSFRTAATAVDVNVANNIISVGLEDGGIVLLDSTTFEIIEAPEVQGNGRINRVAWHRSQLAVASETLRVFTYAP